MDMSFLDLLSEKRFLILALDLFDELEVFLARSVLRWKVNLLAQLALRTWRVNIG